MTTSTDTQIGGYVFHEGDRIRKAREQMELSQTELAERTGISKGTISTYENGGDVKRAYRLLIAMSLGVSAEWLKSGQFSTGHGSPEGLPGDVNSGYRTRRRYLPAIIPSFAQIYAEAA